MNKRRDKMITLNKESHNIVIIDTVNVWTEYCLDNSFELRMQMKKYIL